MPATERRAEPHTRAALPDTLARLRLLEVDHDPDGWPAVRMRDISVLMDEVESQRKRGDAVIAALRSLRDVCTTPGESKADFVERVKAILGADPDARIEALYAAEARLRALTEAEPAADMPEAFEDYMITNYPPRTVISDPKWHAPRIWRAVRRTIRAAAPAPAVPDGWREFIAECATYAGKMINGNRLSDRAAALLAAAPEAPRG